MRQIVVLVAALALPLVANAGTKVIQDGCLKYVATGKVYDVRIDIVDGTDLALKFGWANPLDKYAIAFWNQEEAVVINLGPFGFLMDTGNDGTDRQGRQWVVARRPWC